MSQKATVESKKETTQKTEETKKETTQKTALDSIKITDKETLNKIKAEMIEPYISKDEEGTMDDDVLDKNRYTNSAEEIGGQYIPIAVAYCPTDPTILKNLDDGNDNPDYNPESPFRVHGRIIDGRHRWIDAKSKGVTWDITYYKIKDYNHYTQLRKHLDQKKAPNRLENEIFFASVCKYVFEKEGVPLEDVCKEVVNRFKNTMSEPAIRSYIPAQFKDSKMAALRQGAKKDLEETVLGKKIVEKLKKQTGKELSKKDKEIQKLHIEQSENLNKIIELEGQIKTKDEIVNKYNDLQPFLKTVHKTKVDGADIEVEVTLDLTTKNVIVKKI